ncbi:hypothetical protein [uncultured Solobacterium sp.]|jgi:hypothetical protein|uniref:hypothetical protein n=1 Tax=uncultured Solobacterium sp. TaxID=747375 RepID=UPI00260F5090|nr:hypothetical protein [uncultured Solobacterium sp.]
MKKLVSFVICLLCALIMVVAFLLSYEWGNRNNSQSLSQIREIEGLENQLAKIPTGYVNGFGESDTIYTSTKRVSTDTTLMDQLWTSAFVWNSPEEYANQRTSIISTYNLNTETQFFREGMIDPTTITDGSNPTFEGLSDMKYLKQDVQLVSIKEDVYRYFVRISYYTANHRSETPYRFCYILCDIDANQQITNLEYYSSKGWE